MVSSEQDKPPEYFSNYENLRRTVELNAKVGEKTLQMVQFPRPIRWLAKLAARIFLYLAQVVTIPQRQFNCALIQMMQILQGRLVDLEEEMTDCRKTLYSVELCLKDQERRLRILIEEAVKRMPGPLDEGYARALSDEEDHLLDPFYVSLQNAFRGSRDEIKNRMKAYLPLIKEIQADIVSNSIVDLGCGRGEWLELLKEEGYTACGLDLNRSVAEQCRELGLDVVEADMLDYLRSIASGSLGAVTGFQIVEHLQFQYLIALVDEALRVLKPGGLAIFETPNPRNILVGACNFYLDPTHRNPLPPDLLKFIFDSRGFERVNIELCNPYNTEFLISDESEFASRFNELFYGPQDYAVVAYKSEVVLGPTRSRKNSACSASGSGL